MGLTKLVFLFLFCVRYKSEDKKWDYGTNVTYPVFIVVKCFLTSGIDEDTTKFLVPVEANSEILEDIGILSVDIEPEVSSQLNFQYFHVVYSSLLRILMLIL